LAHLAFPTLGLVLDGSVVGRGGGALRIPVVSKGRALPLAWVVRHGTTGHLPEALPRALLEQGHERLPPGAQVVGLGDGEVNGAAFQPALQAAGWSSGCRPGSPVTAWWNGRPLRLETVQGCLKPGTVVELPAAAVTREAYGPMLRLWCWAPG
jgi:hypothetical protein